MSTAGISEAPDLQFISSEKEQLNLAYGSILKSTSSVVGPDGNLDSDRALLTKVDDAEIAVGPQGGTARDSSNSLSKESDLEDEKAVTRKQKRPPRTSRNNRVAPGDYKAEGE